MVFSNSQKPDLSDAFLGAALIDVMAIFAGFFSLVLIIIFTAIYLLLEPNMMIDTNLVGGSLITKTWQGGTVFFVVFVVVLALATRLNDFLITKNGRKYAIHTSLFLGHLGCALNFFGAPSVLFFILTALSIGLFVILWGSVLSTINSMVLTFILMTASVFAGIVVFLVDTQLSAKEISALMALLYVVSWITPRRFSPALTDQITLVTRKASIKRYVPGKGNRFTLLLVGMILGVAAVLTQTLHLSARELTLAIGVCLLLAGLIIALFYRDLHSDLGSVSKRILALIMTLSLVPFLFVGSTGQLVCVCFLFTAGIVNLILIVDSILETSRFNQISPFWIVGLEGSMLFSGVILSLIVSTILMTLFANGFEITLFVFVCSAAILQININNQAYPLFKMVDVDISDIESEENSLTELEPEIAVDYSASWRKRLDAIAEDYHLSLRQKEIMELLVMGRDLNYITTRLGISRSTAKTHLSNLYRRMDLHSKQELLDLMEPSDSGGIQ